MDFIIVMHNVNSVNIMYVFIFKLISFYDTAIIILAISIFKISVYYLMDTDNFMIQDMEVWHKLNLQEKIMNLNMQGKIYKEKLSNTMSCFFLTKMPQLLGIN